MENLSIMFFGKGGHVIAKEILRCHKPADWGSRVL